MCMCVGKRVFCGGDGDGLSFFYFGGGFTVANVAHDVNLHRTLAVWWKRRRWGERCKRNVHARIHFK